MKPVLMKDDLNLDGWTLYNRNYGTSLGGVCLYVDSLHSVMVCDDFAINAGHLDSLFIEI